MPFNKDINGFKNENEFIRYLNGKKVGKVNPIFQDLLFKLYDNLSYKDLIFCRPNYDKQKSDMIIEINGIEKRISIKKGVKNSVHIEPFPMFILFLKDCGISDEIINEVKLFHYGDGSADGSGEARISSLEYKEKHQDKLDLINYEFNKIDVVLKAIDRFVLFGNNSNEPIDAIIYGVLEDFIWITRDEIRDIILRNRDIKRTGLGFGSLFYQPMNRCLNHNLKYDHDRHIAQIKWYHLSDDIIEMMAERNIKST